MMANGSMGWVGQHQKITESHLVLSPINMGARLYIPTLGRFTSVDPVEGGVENNYVYPPDPVNEQDLTGEVAFLIPVAIMAARIAMPIVARASIAVLRPVAAATVKNLNHGAHRVTIEAGKYITKYDLKGAAHFEKTAGRLIPTPHKRIITMTTRGPIVGPVMRMTFRDMTRVIKHLRRK